jgi:hypothetical protein
MPKPEVRLVDCWRIADGVIEVIPDAARASDLWTVAEFGAFEMGFEFWPGAGANAGVKFQGKDAIYVDDLAGKQRVIARAEELRPGARLIVYTPALEYQVSAPDEPDGMRKATSRAGSLYNKVAAPTQVSSLREQWNGGRIRLEADGRLRFWLNGALTVEHRLPEPLVRRPIVLQHHGSLVRFRNLEAEAL